MQLSCRLSWKGSLNAVVGRFEIVEKLVLKAVEDADEKVLTLDWLARAVVEGYDHRGFVAEIGRLSCGLLRLPVRHITFRVNAHRCGHVCELFC